MRRRSFAATALGITAILLWSASVPGARLAVEGFGIFQASAVILALGGLFLLALTSIRMRGVGWIGRLSRKHVICCAPLFVGYMVLLYMSVGIAGSREEALVAGLANYLWPTSILIFSILILKQRARGSMLATGIVVALSGVALAASLSSGGLHRLGTALWPPPLAIGLGFLAAILWGLYSVLAHKHPERNPAGAIGLYLLTGGVILAAVGADGWQDVRWDLASAIAVGCMALLPNSLAYWFWAVAVRDGNVPALGALANLIPVLSAAIGTVVLGTGLRWEILLGGTLVAGGAALSHAAFRRSS